MIEAGFIDLISYTKFNVLYTFQVKRVRYYQSWLYIFVILAVWNAGFILTASWKINWRSFFKGRVGCQKTFEIELREMDGRWTELYARTSNKLCNASTIVRGVNLHTFQFKNW